MSAVDEYLNHVSPAQRPALDRIRKIVHRVAPDAEEAISYGMPGFKYKKKYLITYAPFKDHSSIFPGAEAIEANKKELEGFICSKGTVQFTDDKQIPEDVIVAIIKNRMQSIDKEK